jgi:hypothetical protein
MKIPFIDKDYNFFIPKSVEITNKKLPTQNGVSSHGLYWSYEFGQPEKRTVFQGEPTLVCATISYAAQNIPHILDSTRPNIQTQQLLEKLKEMEKGFVLETYVPFSVRAWPSDPVRVLASDPVRLNVDYKIKAETQKDAVLQFRAQVPYDGLTAAVQSGLSKGLNGDRIARGKDIEDALGRLLAPIYDFVRG